MQDGLRHLGVIMDGNRRWAKKNGLTVVEGHTAGFKNLKSLLKTIQELKIEYLTVYAFSTENWRRSQAEVTGLMKLATTVLTHEVEDINQQNIRIRFLGTRERLDGKLQQLMDSAEAKTASNDGGTLAICFNYGGKQEIVDAARAVVSKGEHITEDSLNAHVYAPDMPDVDLIIRTSGEKRISNFMMWQGSYAEIEFTDTLWPDFSGKELREITTEYLKRNRRFGG